MKQHLTASTLLASLLTAGVFVLSLPASAQMGPGKMDDQMGNSMPGPGAQQMSGLQHDMANQMMGMSSEMGKGNMNAAQQKMMSERMQMIGTMMGDMSNMMGQGKMGQGLMMDTDTQKNFNQMRMRMDGMMHSGSPKMK